MNANQTKLYAITNAQYEAHYRTQTGSGLIFPSHFYNCISKVDTKDLAENMGLKRKTDIVGVLITNKQHPGFKNKRNNFVQYKSPTCAESTYDGAFQHTIPEANNGKGFTYWATLNPLGDVIIVLKDIHNDDIVKKGRWNQPPELFVKPPECWYCGDKGEELQTKNINKTERLMCAECVAEIFDDDNSWKCYECRNDKKMTETQNVCKYGFAYCDECASVAEIFKPENKDAPNEDDQDLIIIKGAEPEPIPMVSISIPQLHKPDIIVEVPEPLMVEYDGIRMRQCLIPCKTSPKMGKSWWKGFGYDSPCACAYETRNKHNEEQKEIPAPKAKAPRKKVSPLNADKCVWETTGCMDENFLRGFLYEKLNATQKRDADKCFKADPEAFIEYRNYSFRGATDGDIGLFYSEIWLLDLSTECGGKYSPVVVNRINTSSAYAMSRCGMDRDEDEDEDEEKKEGRFKYTELPKLFKTEAINGERFWASVRHHFV
jgi:hypothetical protein